MHEDFIDQVEAYSITHGGMAASDARDLCRQLYRGERVELPAASTPGGAVIRQLLSDAISSFLTAGSPHASAGAGEPVAPAQPVAAVPSSASTFERHMHLAKIAPGAEMAATVASLAASSMPLDQAAETLRIAQQAALSAAPRIPSIEERAAGMAEMGPAGDFQPMSKADIAKAGWTKAFAKAEAKTGGTLRIGG